VVLVLVLLLTDDELGHLLVGINPGTHVATSFSAQQVRCAYEVTDGNFPRSKRWRHSSVYLCTGDLPDPVSNSMLLGLNRRGKRGSEDRIENGFSFKRMFWVGLTRHMGPHSGLHRLC